MSRKIATVHEISFELGFEGISTKWLIESLLAPKFIEVFKKYSVIMKITSLILVYHGK